MRLGYFFDRLRPGLADHLREIHFGHDARDRLDALIGLHRADVDADRPVVVLGVGDHGHPAFAFFFRLLLQRGSGFRHLLALLHRELPGAFERHPGQVVVIDLRRHGLHLLRLRVPDVGRDVVLREVQGNLPVAFGDLLRGQEKCRENSPLRDKESSATDSQASTPFIVSLRLAAKLLPQTVSQTID